MKHTRDKKGEKEIEVVSKHLFSGSEAIDELKEEITNLDYYLELGDDDPDKLLMQVQEYEETLKSKEEELVSLESIYMMIL